MNLPQAAVDLVRHFEGLRLRAYYCPAGVLTIGHGHTAAAGPPIVTEGMVITAAEAQRILAQDLATFACGVRPLITASLSDNQFGAIVSFAFNVGLTTFRKSSVLQRVNAGFFEEVPERLALYNKGGGVVLPGLVRRRAAEVELWRAG